MAIASAAGTTVEPTTVEPTTVEPAQHWFQGAAGQSCTGACGARGLACNASGLQYVDTGLKLRTVAQHLLGQSCPSVRFRDDVGAIVPYIDTASDGACVTSLNATDAACSALPSGIRLCCCAADASDCIAAIDDSVHLVSTLGTAPSTTGPATTGGNTTSGAALSGSGPNATVLWGLVFVMLYALVLN